MWPSQNIWMFSTDFIFRQQINLVDNQKCQSGFRPLCKYHSWITFTHRIKMWGKNPIFSLKHKKLKINLQVIVVCQNLHTLWSWNFLWYLRFFSSLLIVPCQSFFLLDDTIIHDPDGNYPHILGENRTQSALSLHHKPYNSVMRVRSDTFGNPIFQKGLQN